MTADVTAPPYSDCGSLAAVKRHGRHGTPLDDACREEKNRRMQSYSVRSGRTKDVKVPVVVVEDALGMLRTTDGHPTVQGSPGWAARLRADLLATLGRAPDGGPDPARHMQEWRIRSGRTKVVKVPTDVARLAVAALPVDSQPRRDLLPLLGERE